MTRAELIRKLLETNHLSVPERCTLVPETIHISELASVVREVVDRESRFCAPAVILEKSADGKYVLRRLTDPRSRLHVLACGTTGDAVRVVLAGTMSSENQPTELEMHSTVESALDAFVRRIVIDGSTWGQPPGTIDGIEIVGLPNPVEPTSVLSAWSILSLILLVLAIVFCLVPFYFIQNSSGAGPAEGAALTVLVYGSLSIAFLCVVFGFFSGWTGARRSYGSMLLARAGMVLHGAILLLLGVVLVIAMLFVTWAAFISRASGG
jgi:hypothetical protein